MSARAIYCGGVKAKHADSPGMDYTTGGYGTWCAAIVRPCAGGLFCSCFAGDERGTRYIEGGDSEHIPETICYGRLTSTLE